MPDTAYLESRIKDLSNKTFQNEYVTHTDFLSVSARGRKATPPTPPVRSSIGFKAAGRCVPPRKRTSFPLNSHL